MKALAWNKAWLLDLNRGVRNSKILRTAQKMHEKFRPILGKFQAKTKKEQKISKCTKNVKILEKSVDFKLINIR